MNQRTAYSKYIDTISKEEFVSFYTTCKPEEWFSVRELQVFKFPMNVRSLAGRYLIKRTICNYIKEHTKMAEIEILNDDFGKPAVLLGENIRHFIGLIGIKNIFCSISHSRNFIACMTILCY